MKFYNKSVVLVIFSLSLSACATSNSPSLLMVGSTTAGPEVASAVSAAGIRNIDQRFEGSGAGVTDFCGQKGSGAADILVLSRALRSDEADQCNASGVAYRSLESNGNAVIVRESSINQIEGLAGFSDGLGI